MSETGDVVKAVGAAIMPTLGPWGVIAGLALQFGTDFVDQMFENAKNNVDPTAEAWAALRDKIKTPFKEL